jgi:isoleucyl-tRNA synthetase
MLFQKAASTVSAKREEELLKFWDQEKIFQKSISNREGAKPFVFFEGPPTANGTPHPGHVLTKALKDLVPRYKTMCGCKVDRKAGWDTHGLPVELEVEKQLGMTCKQDIEKYGIEKFIKKCRESVFKYEKEWRRMCERGGFWIDMDHPYITCTDPYIETGWWVLSQFWKEGLLYEGHKVVPYCPRCGTALSSHEVAQGYDEVEDPSVFVRFKVKNQENTFFLVWTTTPWTLLSNVALAVGKDIEYVKVKHNDQILILAKARLAVLNDEGEVQATVKGEELLGLEYEQLFPYVKPAKRAHYVIAAEFVSTEDGTGIVHIAPAFGEDDYRVGKANDLPVMQPVNMAGQFTEEVTPWAGRFVKDADSDIIKDLKKSGKLFRSERIKHTYPFCWRCDSPLLYYARHSWFIKTTAFKDEVLKNNDLINWFPEHVKEGRFKNFLDNMIDWAISRDRYWGTPLPIWKCSCGYQHCIGSREELMKMGKNVPADLELHKPYVDDVEITCPKCQGGMKRVPEVIDCWFDSGIMHTAQWHYPFENQETFKSHFPADFICEAVDQTRGWFYSLLVTSTFLHKAPAFKNVVVLGLICDKNGLKMSKSKGNVLDCMSLFDKYGADAVRWSLYSGTAPWNTRRFYEEAIAESLNRYLGTLQNVYSFFVLYANMESFNPLEHQVQVKERPELDRWIIACFQKTVEEVRAAMDAFEVTRATHLMETFIDDLSNWYVRRSRRRFWSNEWTVDKKSAFLTLWEVLVGFAKVTAPFTPFIADEIYRNLVGSIDPKAQSSVHLVDYPVAEKGLIDEALLSKMHFIRKVVVLGRAARSEANLKVRQPLADMKVVVKDKSQVEILENMISLIDEELNVKKVLPVTSADELVKYTVKPNFRSLGQGSYKSLIPAIKKHLEAVDGVSVKQALAKGTYQFELGGQVVQLAPADVDIVTVGSGEYAVQEEGGLVVALNKNLTRELILEGLAREVVNKIQNMRKDQGFEISDRIRVSYEIDDAARKDDLIDALKAHQDYIMRETLTKHLCPAAVAELNPVEWNINGIKVRMAIAKEIAS